MKWLKWIDNNILKILLVFFVFFIPLFPKFPFQSITYTYISVRFDDFFVALIVAVYILQVIRKKVSLKDLPYWKPILAFWGIVFAALLSGIFITKTVDYHFLGLLNAARRVQYMILFFIAFSSIKKAKDFSLLLYSLMASNFLIIVYGIGQRFFDFPAVSTMNPEFAKGRILFLTPEARLSSTFAGHYDLSGYLVFIMPILWGLFFYLKQKKKLTIPDKERWLVFTAALLPILMSAYLFTRSVYAAGFIETALSASQAPFNQIIVMTMAISILLYFLLFDISQKLVQFVINIVAILILVFTASRTASIAFLASISAYMLYVRKIPYMILVVVLTLGLSYVDKDLIQRWFSTIQVKQVVLNEKTGEQAVVQKIKSDELPAGTSFVKLKESNDSTESTKLKIQLSNEATMSGNLEATPSSYETVTVAAADVSLTTRFQASWPRAIRAFMRNPLLGTGPSSITEASDGDYFRWIGETGALGAGLFMYILFLIVKDLFVLRKKLGDSKRMLAAGFVFGLFGLLINALLIDIFEASKVAYIFWTTAGVFVAMSRLDKDELDKL